MQEIWKDIPQLKGQYQVSNFGRIKSLERTIEYLRVRSNGTKHKQTTHVPEKILKTYYDAIGYSQLTAKIKPDKKKTCFKVHQLVWDAFGSGSRTNMDIDHIDNNKSNNNINNLRLLTHRDNSARGHDKRRKSRFRGVRIYKNSYVARIWVKGIGEINLGHFNSEVEAGLAYLKAKLKYTGSLGEI